MNDTRIAEQDIPAGHVRCPRCGGTGFHSFVVVHCGVPGLCWDCDGARYVTVEFVRQREQAAAKARTEAAAFKARRDAGLPAVRKAIIDASKVTATPSRAYDAAAGLDRLEEDRARFLAMLEVFDQGRVAEVLVALAKIGRGARPGSWYLRTR